MISARDEACCIRQGRGAGKRRVSHLRLSPAWSPARSGEPEMRALRLCLLLAIAVTSCAGAAPLETAPPARRPRGETGVRPP